MKSNPLITKYRLCRILFVLVILGSLQACREKQAKPAVEQSTTLSVDAAGFESIFDGATLTHWEGDSTYWRAENGTIVGEITPETLLKKNTFLIYNEDELGDFELKTEFRISESGNSGINYRSDLLDTIPFALRGYQADIDGKNRYTGQNYEERKRTTLAYRGEKLLLLHRKTQMS